MLTGDADSNLHAYWDNLPGSDCKFCNDKVSCLNRAIVFASNLKPVSRAAARNTETAAWLKESFDYARSKIYQAPIGTGDGPYTIVPLSSYDFKAYRLAQKRIALGGARLAWILNSELR